VAALPLRRRPPPQRLHPNPLKAAAADPRAQPPASVHAAKAKANATKVSAAVAVDVAAVDPAAAGAVNAVNAKPAVKRRAAKHRVANRVASRAPKRRAANALPARRGASPLVKAGHRAAKVVRHSVRKVVPRDAPRAISHAHAARVSAVRSRHRKALSNRQ
jgi:hypothetical protein